MVELVKFLNNQLFYILNNIKRKDQYDKKTAILSILKRESDRTLNVFVLERLHDRFDGHFITVSELFKAIFKQKRS